MCVPSTWDSPAMASALELRNISAGYGETVVLEDVTLSLAPGECISVIGRNGVGKTTLLATVIVEALTAVLIRLRQESGLSIVLVEQNSRVALAFSPRTAIMDRGRIVYDGPSEALGRDADKLHRLIGVAKH